MSALAGKLHVRVAAVWTPVGDGADASLPINDDGGSLTVDAVTLPLPTGAAAEHITAISPHAVRLTDGAAFYATNTGAQLPAALVGGRLDVNLGSKGVGFVLSVDDNASSLTVDAAVGTPVFVRLSDGAAALIGQKVMASSVPVVVASDQKLAVHGFDTEGSVMTANPLVSGGRTSYPALPSPAVGDARSSSMWTDRHGAQIVRKRPVAMYSAHYRLANSTGGHRGLAPAALTANTNKQVATIHHAVGATKRVQIKYVELVIYQLGAVAGSFEAEIVQLSATTAPATGNPAITPGKHDGVDAAAEATCLALPTTQGSVVNADATVGYTHFANYGITAGGPTKAPHDLPTKLILWNSLTDGDGKDLIIRAATAEGFAINIRSNVAMTWVGTASIIFTEE